MRDVTLTIAVDKPHLRELRLTAPTWFRHWPEFRDVPLLVFADEEERPEWWAIQIGQFMEHPNATIVPWPRMVGLTQRARMVSAFVHGVARYCETPWHLKLDTDLACIRRDDNCFPDEWFADDVAFASHKWGYTKPASRFIELTEWAKTVRAFDGTPEAPGHWDGDPAEVVCKHKRIMSFFFVGNTEFVKQASRLARGFGPAVPSGSHDTFLWYVAVRQRRRWIRGGMHKLGWSHGARKLEQRCLEAMR